MQTGIIPEALNVAEIIPIYKADDPNEFINYRPISILPILSKILEKVIAAAASEPEASKLRAS